MSPRPIGPSRLRRGFFDLLLIGLASGLVGLYWHFIWRATGPFQWRRGDLSYEIAQPRALGLLLIVPFLLWVLGRSLADLPWQQRVLSVLARILFLASLALGLSGLVRTVETKKVCLVLLVDVSDSVSDRSLDVVRQRIDEAIRQRPEQDLIRLIAFAERPSLIELEPDKDGKIPIPSVAALREQRSSVASGEGHRATRGTNLQAALQLAYGIFPPGYLKRALLFSDGVETAGNVLAEASRAAELGVRVSTVPYREPMPAEVAIRSLQLPDKVELGSPFKVIADVYASRQTSARARLYQGEVLNGLAGVRSLALKPGSNEVVFDSVVRVGGEVTYRLLLDQIAEDQFEDNNHYSATLEVPGRPAVLYVEGQPERASYLTNALTAQQFDVDVRAASGLPTSLAELERYGMVILSDVPAEQVSTSAQDSLERYVRDLGGGLLFAGGEAGFGLGGWSGSTLERILPVRMDAERHKDIPSVALVLVIDRSGSMTGLPLEMAKTACSGAVGTLKGDDLVEVIAFDSLPKPYVKMQAARARSRIQDEISQIEPGGGTAIFPALDAAYQDISVVAARKKHVILLTDGRADNHGIRDLVQAMVAENITVTTVGLGDGVDSDLLRMIADTGGGRYHNVPDPSSLPRIFTRETELISRQAAVEEWFPVVQTANADFLRGIEISTAPLLHGYVATEMKSPPAEQILQSDRGEPILARLRVGLGYTLAWTSDLKNNWAIDWLRWNEFGRFWGQLVREHIKSKHRRELEMQTEVVGDRVHASIDAFNAAERFDNELLPRLFVSGPEPKGERKEVTMRQTAPGRYESWFRLDQYGSFLLDAELDRENDRGERSSVATSYGHVSLPYPQEYASFEPDLERLARVALVSSGRSNPRVAELFEPGTDKIVYHEPLWPRFIYLALGLFLIDLLLRRVRLFDRKFLAAQRRTV